MPASFVALPNNRDKENPTAKARIGIITLGVDGLQVSLKFYRDGLGLQTEGIIGTEFERGAIVAFNLQHGVKLALSPCSDIALDAGIATTGGTPLSSHSAKTLAVKVKSMRQAIAPSARLLKPAQDFLGRICGLLPRP